MDKRSYSPTSPARRHMTRSAKQDVTRQTPEKSLTQGASASGGRNSAGRITVRARGGGVKRRYRQVDFRRDKDGVPARVAHIEYDPNRSARLALLHYADGEKRYILAPLGVKVGQTVMSGPEADFKPGNAMCLRDIPEGISIHNIELQPGHGASMVRSAGAVATLRAKEGQYAQVRLPSGEIRMVHLDCRATIGQVGLLDHASVSLGKAGKNRHLGRRPQSRGVVMNPHDHPMGGGEGRSSGGGHPVSPWGQLAKGYRTRNKRKNSSKFIVQRRKKK